MGYEPLQRKKMFPSDLPYLSKKNTLIDLTHHICEQQIISQPEAGTYLFWAHLRILSNCWRCFPLMQIQALAFLRMVYWLASSGRACVLNAWASSSLV